MGADSGRAEPIAAVNGRWPVLRLRSLQLHFTLVLVVGATVVSVLFGALAYLLGYERAIDFRREALGAMAQAVEKTAAVGAYARDAILLDELTGGLARNPMVARVEVRAPDGTLLAQRGEPRAAEVADVVIVTPLAAPFDSKEIVGSLRIEADQARLRADARGRAGALAAAMVAQTVVLALLLYVFGARLVSQPIVRLAHELREAQPGSGRRLTTPWSHRDDELGTLIAGANALLETNDAALQRERELRGSVEAMEAQYRQIFDSTSAGIFVLGPDGRLINGNPTVLKVIGVPVEQIRQWRGSEFVRRVFARPERVEAMIDESIARGETVSADLELMRSDSVARWVHCLISVQGDAATGSDMIEGVMYDITDRRRAEHDARHQAEHDPLTGLKNRAASEAQIDRFIAEAAAAGGAMALLYIDLDGFKQVNDRLGHKAGDAVLQRCAERLQAAVRRASDLVGRIGGDEFIVALTHSGPQDIAVAQIAQHIVTLLCEPLAIDGEPVQIGASIGIACFPHHGTQRRQLMQAADEAMYEVKRSGKNSFAMAAAPSSAA
ncbi:diguanylate cyclase [Aquincola sp. S2]|uniref:Diguanylate cyclase n=1 Tax=Pseudaquabacterium terrae TaxID=2732868 RepID=A0ABX2EUD1_9BURK|nr:sensor domain-containing diguanylate cyclase [Aquabacterium terrae]NRF72097.1 diguanylate cyclase [Aquabacterium terrae]